MFGCSVYHSGYFVSVLDYYYSGDVAGFGDEGVAVEDGVDDRLGFSRIYCAKDATRDAIAYGYSVQLGR